jgi:hypothetical protein
MKKILLVLVAILSLLALTSCASSDDCIFCDYNGSTRCEVCYDEDHFYPAGVIVCALCEGRGHVEGIDCIFCGARGYNSCSSCQGYGYIDCPFCNRHS